MRPIGIVLVASLLAAASCSAETAPDSLAQVQVDLERGRRLYLASLEVRPDRDLSVVGVELRADPGVRHDYLGYVTRCGEWCGIRPVGTDEVEAVRRGTEGTVPFEVREDQADVHLLFALRLTPTADRVVEATGCIVVREVRLELASGEEIAVRRPGVRFLWVLAPPDDDRCAREALVS